MITLGVDTSTASLSVSLVDEKKILTDYNSSAVLKHADLLVPVIKKALKKVHAGIDDISLFSISIGPGSFTGLRVGVTAMRALAIALDKPIIGIPTMDAIAHNGFAYLKRSRLLDKYKKICPVLDAKKKQVYACIYRHDNGLLEKETSYLLEPADVVGERVRGSVLFLGDAVCLYKEQLRHRKHSKARFLDGRTWMPKASVIAKMALRQYKKGKTDDPYNLVPMYLYARDCNVRKQ